MRKREKNRLKDRKSRLPLNSSYYLLNAEAKVSYSPLMDVWLFLDIWRRKNGKRRNKADSRAAFGLILNVVFFNSNSINKSFSHTQKYIHDQLILGDDDTVTYSSVDTAWALVEPRARVQIVKYNMPALDRLFRRSLLLVSPRI